MSLVAFAEQWRAAQTFDYTTRERIGGRLRVHIYPYFDGRSLASLKPSDIQGWLRWMQDANVAQNYRVLLFTHLASILNAAVDDKRILENPCHAKSVSRPRADQTKIEVWSHERAYAVRDALPDRYKIAVTIGAGCGLRQGEVFGLSPEDVDPETETVNVVRQVRLVDHKPVFAPPKRGKTRSVPLPAGVARALDDYAREFEPTELTLPWMHPGGRSQCGCTWSTTGGTRAGEPRSTGRCGGRRLSGPESPSRPGRTACTRCGTCTPRSCSTRASRSRHSLSTSGTPTLGSPCGSTPTCCRPAMSARGAR